MGKTHYESTAHPGKQRESYQKKMMCPNSFESNSNTSCESNYYQQQYASYFIKDPPFSEVFFRPVKQTESHKKTHKLLSSEKMAKKYRVVAIKSTLQTISILFYPTTLQVRRDITDYLATIPFHLILFSTILGVLAYSIAVKIVFPLFSL